MDTRIAIVAGAGGGLGQATARALHAAGLAVVGIDRNETGLKALPDDIHREVADATDPAVPGPLIDRVAAEFGPPDVLVNTIGAHQMGDAMSVTPEALSQLIAVNVGTALWLTQAVVPHMRRRGSGKVVHVGARPGVEATAGAAAYGVSKAGLAHLVRILDLELRPLGIQVNAIVPQLIRTAANEAFLPPAMLAHAVAPESLAEVITGLVGDRFGPVSGALIPTYGE
jgi:NAD(P)-dependent dehydrogenase (short-subunit alcohol dehydrogenase family)